MAEVLSYKGDKGFPNLGAKVVKKETPEPGKVYDYGFIAENDLETLKGLASDPGKLGELNTFFESLRPQTARIFSPETSSDGTIEPETAYTYIKMGLIPLHKPEFDLDGKNFIVFSRLESSIQNNGLFGTEEGLVKAKEAYREYKKNTSKGENALTVLRETQGELVTANDGWAITTKELRETQGELESTNKSLKRVQVELNDRKEILRSTTAELDQKTRKLQSTKDDLNKATRELYDKETKLFSTTKERDDFLQKLEEAEDQLKVAKTQLGITKPKAITHDSFLDAFKSENYGYPGCAALNAEECKKNFIKKKDETDALKLELGEKTRQLGTKNKDYELSQAQLNKAKSELEKTRGIYDYFSDNLLTELKEYGYNACDGEMSTACLDQILNAGKENREKLETTAKELDFNKSEVRTKNFELENIRKDKTRVEEALEKIKEAASKNDIEACKRDDFDECISKVTERLENLSSLKQLQAAQTRIETAGYSYFIEKEMERRIENGERDTVFFLRQIIDFIREQMRLNKRNEKDSTEEKKRKTKDRKTLNEVYKKLIEKFISNGKLDDEETIEIVEVFRDSKRSFSQYFGDYEQSLEDAKINEDSRVVKILKKFGIPITVAGVTAYMLWSQQQSGDVDPIVEPDPYIDAYNPPFYPRGSFNFTEPDPIPPNSQPTPEVSQESSSIFNAATNAFETFSEGFSDFLKASKRYRPNRAPISGLMMPHTARSSILASRLMY